MPEINPWHGAITTTALRHRGALLAVMKEVMDRPAPERARYLIHTLHTATAQILFMQLPDSAAVNLGVSIISSHPSTQRFKGFANAVLRCVAREKQKLIEGVASRAVVTQTCTC